MSENSTINLLKLEMSSSEARYYYAKYKELNAIEPKSWIY